MMCNAWSRILCRNGVVVVVAVVQMMRDDDARERAREHVTEGVDDLYFWLAWLCVFCLIWCVIIGASTISPTI